MLVGRGRCVLLPLFPTSEPHFCKAAVRGKRENTGLASKRRETQVRNYPNCLKQTKKANGRDEDFPLLYHKRGTASLAILLLV